MPAALLVGEVEAAPEQILDSFADEVGVLDHVDELHQPLAGFDARGRHKRVESERRRRSADGEDAEIRQARQLLQPAIALLPVEDEERFLVTVQLREQVHGERRLADARHPDDEYVARPFALA